MISKDFVQALLALVLCTSATLVPDHSYAGEDVRTLLHQVSESDHRDPKNKKRDTARHPIETLLFFGIKPEMTVVEIRPGGRAWYTEFIAPFLKDHGRYIAAGYDQSSDSEYVKKNTTKFHKKVIENSEVYGGIVLTEFAPPKKVKIAEPGSADMVLTFRNSHAWIKTDPEKDTSVSAYKAFYDALKPGGILGVVQHRLNEDAGTFAQGGYVKQSHLIKVAEEVGFKLVASSELNANPKDSKDHPEGVWTLPPALALGDKDRDKYLAIGESDRMTLKFVKK